MPEKKKTHKKSIISLGSDDAITLKKLFEHNRPDNVEDWDKWLVELDKYGIITLGDLRNKSDHDWDEIPISDKTLKHYLNVYRGSKIDKKRSHRVTEILEESERREAAGNKTLEKSFFKAKIWAFFAALFALITSIEVPFAIFFYPAISKYLLPFNIIADLFFVADLIVVRKVIKKLKPLKKNPKIRRNINLYYHDIVFIDAFTCIPFELIGVALGHLPGSLLFSCLRLPKLIRCHRFQKTRKFVHKSLALRVLRVLTSFLLFLHLITCIYYGISKFQTPKGNRWTGEAFVHAANLINADLPTQYMTSFWFAVTAMLTADGDSYPGTNFEKCFGMAIFISGIPVYGYFYGQMSSLVREWNQNRNEREMQIEMLRKYSQTYALPRKLQRRIKAHMLQEWKVFGGFKLENFMTGLPRTISTDVKRFLFLELVEKVDLFRGTDSAFKNTLVHLLRSEIYPYREYICREGDIADEMFFLREGKLEVTVHNGGSCGTLKPGDHFGEIGLLEGGGGRRTASVRAIKLSQVASLKRKSFTHLADIFPDFMSKILVSGQKRLDQEKGVEVQAQNSKEKWEFGKIKAKNDDGTFDVHFNSGSFRKKCPVAAIRFNVTEKNQAGKSNRRVLGKSNRRVLERVNTAPITSKKDILKQNKRYIQVIKDTQLRMNTLNVSIKRVGDLDQAIKHIDELDLNIKKIYQAFNIPDYQSHLLGKTKNAIPKMIKLPFVSTKRKRTCFGC